MDLQESVKGQSERKSRYDPHQRASIALLVNKNPSPTAAVAGVLLWAVAGIDGADLTRAPRRLTV